MTLRRAPRSLASLRPPFDRWRERDALLKDGVLALALALAAFVPTLSGIGAQIGDLPEHPANLPGTGLALAQALPLVVRRRWPAACLAVIAGAFAVHQALGFGTTFASVGLYVALYSAGAHQVRFRHGLALATGAGGAVLAVVLHRLGSPQSVPDYLAFFLILATVWLAGSRVRAWRAEEARRRLLAAEAATVTERARVARELHDVVTHHVTAMVIQADAAQFLITSAPERAVEGLAAVSDAGRRALTELRYLFGVLEATGDSAAVDREPVDRAPVDRAPADRAPALGRVGDLVERARSAGQPVEFSRRGERRPQAVGVELAAYRVVQEALTNALKHAPGAPTRVLLRYGDEHLRIEVATDGPATAPAARGTAVHPKVPGGGRGRAGLRARVRMLDGIRATRQLAGPGAEDAPKVLVVTTFNVDAHVYDALRAGASGFLLKDAPPAELLNGIRTVARGEALLAPAVTRHLIGHFARHLRPADDSRTAGRDVVRVLTPASWKCSGSSPRGCRTRRSPRRCSSRPRPSRPTCHASWRNSACGTASRRSSSPTGPDWRPIRCEPAGRARSTPECWRSPAREVAGHEWGGAHSGG